MKSLKLLLFILLAFTYTVQAATITVSLNPDDGAQYDDLQEAIDAAAAGDTILLHPIVTRFTSYGDANINKQLTLIGPGINDEVFGEYATLNGIRFQEQGPTLPDASGSEVIGLVCGFISFSADISDIKIDKCKIGQLAISQWALKDIIVTNCLFKDNQFDDAIFVTFDVENSENILISNNIITGQIEAFYTGTVNTQGALIIKNNVFIDQNVQSNNVVFQKLSGAVIENNIFYASEPQGCTECTFTNNLTYANFNNELIGENSNNPGSVGSGNIINQDPQFVQYDGGVFEWTDDFNLKSESPAIGAGISGTDLGIYGGSYPWNIDVGTIVPEVTSLTITESSVPEDGQLEFTFSAEKQ